jgi:hypothetical protein
MAAMFDLQLGQFTPAIHERELSRNVNVAAIWPTFLSIVPHRLIKFFDAEAQLLIITDNYSLK